MGQACAYFDLLDWLDQRDVPDPAAFLALLRAAYTTGPITYLGGLHGAAHLPPQRIHHSDEQHVRRLTRALHRQSAFEQIAPILTALEPLELKLWKSPAYRHHTTIGYPLPGRQSCLLVELNLAPDQHATWRRMHDRDMLSLGSIFNARLAAAEQDDNDDRRRHLPLTRRERETLAWIAAGKSYWEAAVILGISERTIRHFMANARRKLDVVNNAQAVAEAIWRGLIPRRTEPRREKSD
jgi:LuxR family quorum-sensing system transcriptional regulator SinR